MALNENTSISFDTYKDMALKCHKIPIDVNPGTHGNNPSKFWKWYVRKKALKWKGEILIAVKAQVIT